MDKVIPGYYAVIPAEVRYDDAIPPNAKLLYGEISALISKEGFCYASNAYFMNLYGFSDPTISRLMKQLEDNGYIVREQERDVSGKIVRRRIYLNVSAPDGQPPLKNNTPKSQKQEGGGLKNEGYTNTSITSIDKENKKESPPPKKTKTERAAETDFDPLPLFVEWITATFGDKVAPEGKNALYFALVRFCENRRDIKKPMKSKGAVTALCNKLLRLSDKSTDPVGMMIDMLDTATSSGWQSIYPPKGSPSAAPQQAQKGRVYKEI